MLLLAWLPQQSVASGQEHLLFLSSSVASEGQGWLRLHLPVLAFVRCLPLLIDDPLDFAAEMREDELPVRVRHDPRLRVERPRNLRPARLLVGTEREAQEGIRRGVDRPNGVGR